MKNKLFISIAFFTAIFFNSCTKDNKIEDQFHYNYDPSNIPFESISKITKLEKGISGSYEMLRFENMETYKNLISEFDTLKKMYNDAFISTCKGLTNEQLNTRMKDINFDSDKPLSDFESILDFHSLRDMILEDEKKFLNNGGDDINKDPDNHFVFDDNERALLNVDCEVMIGDSIYKLTEYGYYIITDGNLSTLSILETNLKNYSDLPNVVFNGTFTKVEGCNSNQRSSGYEIRQDIDTKKIKWVVSHWTQIWGERRVAAKVDNYQLVGGNWQKYSCWCATKVFGYISGGEGYCEVQVNFNPNNSFVSGVAEDKEHKIQVQTKTLSGWVKGYYHGADGVDVTKTLTW